MAPQKEIKNYNSITPMENDIAPYRKQNKCSKKRIIAITVCSLAVAVVFLLTACFLSHTYFLNQDQHNKSDINYCVGVTCQNGGTCVDGINGFNCSCVTGYEGTYCANDINDCVGVICQNGGTCVDGINGFNCSCVTGYEGTYCANDTDECALSPCVNNGSCVNGFGHYKCECPPLFVGLNCEAELFQIYQAYIFNGTPMTSTFGSKSSLVGFDFSVDDHIALVDNVNKSVYILDLSLNYISSFPTGGVPTDVAYGSDGLLYVVYFSGGDPLKVFTESGVYQRKISGGSLASPSGISFTVSGIEADSGLLYIALYNNKAILVYHENGTFITQITDGITETFRPSYMALHGGNIYASGNGGSVLVYNSSYEVIQTYPKSQPPLNIIMGGIDIDSYGYMIVPDRVNDVLLIVDSNDVIVGSIGSPGAGLMQLSQPKLASFTPDGNIAVLDHGNNRLQIFVSQ